MMDGHVDWQGDNAFRLVIKAGWEGIRRATHYYFDQVQAVLNTPNSGVDVPLPGGKGSRRVYPNPSKPGEAPHKVSGLGAGSIVEEYDEAALTGRVAVLPSGKHLVYHELGVDHDVLIQAKHAKTLMFFDFRQWKWIFTKRVRKSAQPRRPFLLPTLKRTWAQLQALAGVGAGGNPS